MQNAAIDKINYFIEALSKDELCEVIPSQEINGVKHSPYLISSVVVAEFVDFLYDNDFIVGFKWAEWDYFEKIREDYNLIDELDECDIRKLLTYIVRLDRYVHGTLIKYIECEFIIAVLKRYLEVVKAEG